jgi:fructose-1,6-bisphosphatase/inositol monophosphatase family enzyme
MATSPEETACPEAFVDMALSLAERAREIVGRYFRGDFEVEQKPDLSPVTVADRETEAALRSMIAEAYPDHGVLGEEYGAERADADYLWEYGAERADADYLWVLDPIDGTKRFTTGHAQFGTLIALLHRGRPILGVIDMPEMDERWLGAAGRPTTHQDRRGTRAARARACEDLGAATLYTTAPQMFEGADFEAFERLRETVRTPLYGGECYSYGLLASGFNDLVVEADMDPYDYLSHSPRASTTWSSRPTWTPTTTSPTSPWSPAPAASLPIGKAGRWASAPTAVSWRRATPHCTGPPSICSRDRDGAGMNTLSSHLRSWVPRA